MPAEWFMVVVGEVDGSVSSDWNQWYDEVHLPEILECPGFVRATRYVEEGADPEGFMTLYELDDPRAMESPEFGERRGLGPFGEHATAKARLFRRQTELGSGSGSGSG